MVKYDVTLSDPLLEPFKPVIRRRQEKSLLKELEFTGRERRLSDVFNNHLYFGLHETAEGWVFREWAPNATAIYLVGESSDWQRREDFRLRLLGNGVWELKLPKERMWHGMLYKLWVVWTGGGGERIPAYARRVVQDDETKVFTVQAWQPERPYEWKYPKVVIRCRVFMPSVRVSGRRRI